MIFSKHLNSIFTNFENSLSEIIFILSKNTYNKKFNTTNVKNDAKSLYKFIIYSNNNEKINVSEAVDMLFITIKNAVQKYILKL